MMMLQNLHIVPMMEAIEILRNDSFNLDEYYRMIFKSYRSVNGNIKAFLRENHREERITAALDQLRRRWPNPQDRPPLYGIPFGVKDIYGFDTLPVKAGSSLPPNVIQLPQAHIVNKFQDAGAVVFGKTATTEFAYFQPALTRNPLNLDHTPGGSSSGSAAAVAAGLCYFALGTQTIGSIIRPASYCGVVGFKPSFGRASTHGIFPFSAFMDTPGVICQRLEDLTILAPILCETWHPVFRTSPPRVGIPHSRFLAKATPPALENFQGIVKDLIKKGIDIVETSFFEDIDALEKENHAICSRGFHDTHFELWERYSNHYSTRSIVYILQGAKVSPRQYESHQLSLAERRAKIGLAFVAQGIDLLISPSTTQSAPRGLSGTGSPLMSMPFTHHGLPVLTIPSGMDANGLPFGLQVAAPPRQDEYLISASRELVSRLRSGG